VKSSNSIKIILNRLKELSALLIVVSVLWLFTNSLVNRHRHMLPSGMIIEHAHPYSNNNTPLQQHTHTQQEFIFYSQLTVIQALIIVAVFILIAVIRVYHFPSGLIAGGALNSLKVINRLRPPPVHSK